MDETPWGPCSPWPKQIGEEGLIVDLYPIFETAEQRQEYIKDHANYFVVTWRQNLGNARLEYGTLKAAKTAARFEGVTNKAKAIIITFLIFINYMK